MNTQTARFTDQRNPELYRLCLVTDPFLCAELGVVDTVRAAVKGGVTMVQLRDKDAGTDERVALSLELKEALKGTGVPLIINDDVEAAALSGADGVHVGQSDETPKNARDRMGPGKIVGVSCESAAHVDRIDTAIIDYIGVGTVFGTATKTDHSSPIGFSGLAELCALTDLPILAIGGLKAVHTEDVMKAGASGLAVVSAICGQANPEAAARRFFEAGLERAA